jgi:hypothetical protein
MMIRAVRLYCSRKGIWHYVVERDGKLSWSSLKTRDEKKARQRFEEIKARFEEAMKDER